MEPVTVERVGRIRAIQIENRAPAKNARVVIGALGHTPACRLDITGDTRVTVSHIATVILRFGSEDPTDDVNGDGRIDVGDIPHEVTGVRLEPGTRRPRVTLRNVFGN